MPDSQNRQIKTALIMAGGTGGHIFPGLAIADELNQLGWSTHWLGSKNGMEEKLVNSSNIPLHLISVVGLRGNGLLGWIKAPFMLFSSVYQASKIIRQVEPDVILGFGGFASGPGGFSGYLLNIPLFIHEQNALAGLTNNLLAKIATRVFQAFPNAIKRNKIVETIGNPIRKNIRELQTKPELKSDQIINVLIVGGSRGAAALNQNLPAILRELLVDGKINLLHQCGVDHQAETKSQYALDNQLEAQNLEVIEFIDDISKSYDWANLVICRAGALTVSEVAAAGVAAVFVPYPYAVDDHQTANAKWLVDQGAAQIIQQIEFESEDSSQPGKEKLIGLLNNPKAINKMAANAKASAYLDACKAISNACEQLIGVAA